MQATRILVVWFGSSHCRSRGEVGACWSLLINDPRPRVGRGMTEMDWIVGCAFRQALHSTLDLIYKASESFPLPCYLDP